MVSVFQGNGGLVAEADDADMVTWLSTCDGLTRHGQLAPNDDGIVSMSFQDMGIACHDEEEGGNFEIGPLLDGG